MATIALQIAGTALGSFLGGPFGAAIGSALGGTLGSMVDRSLLGGKKLIEGPRLSDLNGITASEGAPIPRVYGRVRVGGQVIWATEFEEQRTIERSGSSGGKSLKPVAPKTVRYAYFANVAIGLCEGPVNLVRRIWADGEEIDISSLTIRTYLGTEDQASDPLIVAKQETAELPAFRGLVYVVFERFPLEKYGNRLPQFSFEVVRAVSGLPEMIRAINIIPGSTEFGYSAVETRESFGLGASQPINRAQWTHATDWEASTDAMQALMPNLERATLISAWFGDDLRASHCTLRPKVEKSGKTTLGGQWICAGLTRGTAFAVSETEGRPNYGGTPSDQSIIDAIRDLKARGLKVALHPFVLMDVPAINALPDPWTGAAAQPPFPWRGRITPTPAPGRPGSPDGTAAVGAQILSLVGTAAPGHFSRSGDTIHYAGPAEWSLRRMVLHHAMLAQAAGGVDTFIISSELIGLTHACAGSGSFPFVQALAAIVTDVRNILGAGPVITYAADWTEYGAHVRANGQEVRFPLDPVWAHPEVGAIGVDYYAPLSDWRAGRDHADAEIAHGAADRDYLRARAGTGEAFEWYYASSSARTTQSRSPITDGAYAKPWVFRQKDLKSWWENSHVERVGGVELGAPTAYLARRKPIYLTEIGCPAVDKGGNQPNVFPDPKSIENALPHFSAGARDDLVQRRALEALISRFDPAAEGFQGDYNPTSPHYSGRMVEPSFIAPWAWDARPYPAFPRLTSLWSDGENWLRGHWLNGRLEAAPVDSLIEAILSDFGLDAPETSAVGGIVDGYVIDRPMSARATIEPLAALYGLTARGQGQAIAFAGRPNRLVASLVEDDLVPAKDQTLVEIVRRQESELPRRISLGFIDSDNDFRRAVVAAETTIASSSREQNESAPMLVPRAQARKIVETRLQDIWSGRETFKFRLRRCQMALEPGDLIELPTREGPRTVLLTRVVDDLYRECEARAYDPPLADDVPVIDDALAEPGLPALPGAAHARLIELPVERGAGLLQAAVRAEPWRGPYSVSLVQGTSLQGVGTVVASAVVGQTLTMFPPGPLWRWDHASHLDIVLEGGALAAMSDEAVLSGDNALALIDPTGAIEVVLFRDAQLVGERRYRLSRFLRGIGGSEGEAGRILAPGAEVIVLDDALTDLGVGADALGASRNYLILPAGRDVGDPSGVNVSKALSGLALKPLAPLHARARREAGGIRFSFVRRARRDADSWDLFEVPLVEEREEYLFEILSGATVKRSVTLGTPMFLYSSADEAADFGAPQGQIAIRARQISALVGPGHTLSATVPVF